MWLPDLEVFLAVLWLPLRTLIFGFSFYSLGHIEVNRLTFRSGSEVSHVYNFYTPCVGHTAGPHFRMLELLEVYMHFVLRVPISQPRYQLAPRTLLGKFQTSLQSEMVPAHFACILGPFTAVLRSSSAKALP